MPAGRCGTTLQVTVLHIKEAASRHSYRARVEFYRALTLFYEKHYEPPRRSGWIGRSAAACAFFGGLDLLAGGCAANSAQTASRTADRRPVLASAKDGATT